MAHNLTAPLCVVRRASFLAHGQNDPEFEYNFEDYASWISMVAAGCGGVVIHRPLVRYRIRKDSLWQGSNRDQHLYLHDLLLLKHPELYRRYGPELFGLQNANGPAQIWIKPAAPAPFDDREEWHRLEHARQTEAWNQQHAYSKQFWDDSQRWWKAYDQSQRELKAVQAELAQLKSQSPLS